VAGDERVGDDDRMATGVEHGVRCGRLPVDVYLGARGHRKVQLRIDARW
jgi:hypothetical protein